MPTEHDYIDVRDLFASINPNGLDKKDLARDGASFVEPHTINDYHLFRAGYQAALEAQQDQGDLVGQVVAFGHDLHEVSWEKGRMPVLGTKPYTHGAPPEAERLRRALKGAMTLMTEGAARERDSIAELDILRAQLAEAQALLGRIAGADHQDSMRAIGEAAALSASAEPSNDLCAEGAHEFVPFRSECVKCGEPYSAEPSAPKCKFCGGDGYHPKPRSPGVDCTACNGTGIQQGADLAAWYEAHLRKISAAPSAPVEIDEPVCKSAWQLGTACGKCRRCKENPPT